MSDVSASTDQDAQSLKHILDELQARHFNADWIEKDQAVRLQQVCIR